jgi:dethiobiotin synthetase
MSNGIFIIGTDTDVGKTVVSAGLMYLLLKNHMRAAYFKPIASGGIDIHGVSTPADAAFVSAVSGFTEDMNQVTPFFYTESIAPHLAARTTGRPVDITVIEASLAFLKTRYELIVAEGAGGLMVPLDDKGTLQYELIRKLGFPCLLVTRARLGTINHTLLTLRVARDEGLHVKGIVVSGAGQSLVELDNIAMIRHLAPDKPVFVIPHMDGGSAENLQNVFAEAINIDDIVSLMDPI